MGLVLHAKIYFKDFESVWSKSLEINRPQNYYKISRFYVGWMRDMYVFTHVRGCTNGYYFDGM